MEDNPITDYWLKNYISQHGLCSLCGNRGIINTTAVAISHAGVSCGRLNWCICPNGQTLRQFNAPLLPNDLPHESTE